MKPYKKYAEFLKIFNPGGDKMKENTQYPNKLDIIKSFQN